MKGHVLEREKYKNEYGTGENEIQNMRIRRGLVIEYLNRSWAERDSNQKRKSTLKGMMRMKQMKGINGMEKG